VLLKDGNYVCALCGADLDVAEKDMVTTIAGSSGKPNERILSKNGRVIHRCEMRRSGPRRP
jgi:hypothetical protein